VLTPADDYHHIAKHSFKIPFVCGCRNLGEALRRISEGAAMIRTKGEAGTGNVVEAVHHQRTVQAEIRRAAGMSDEELYTYAKEISVRAAVCSLHLLRAYTPPAGAVPPAQGDRPPEAPARRQLRRWRCCHARRRCAHDAARLGRCVRRLWHLVSCAFRLRSMRMR
jgi:hypothetical protein